MPGTFSRVGNIFNPHDWGWGRDAMAPSGKDAIKRPLVHRKVTKTKSYLVQMSVVLRLRNQYRVCSFWSWSPGGWGGAGTYKPSVYLRSAIIQGHPLIWMEGMGIRNSLRIQRCNSWSWNLQLTWFSATEKGWARLFICKRGVDRGEPF